MQNDEKQSYYRVKLRESFAQHEDDTQGHVCIDLLNDTPGFVDNDCGVLMGVISAKKP